LIDLIDNRKNELCQSHFWCWRLVQWMGCDSE
jgi:hypothetical protein